jgi:hypothetical protein
MASNISGGHRSGLGGRAIGGGEGLVEFLLASAEAGELVGVLAGLAEEGFRAGGLVGGGLGVGAKACLSLGEPVYAPFEPLDEYGGVEGAPLFLDEAQVDLGVRHDETDLVLDDRDRLRVDVEPGELRDHTVLDRRVGRRGGQALGEVAAKVFAGVGSFGVALAVDGHGEAVAAGVGGPLDHGGDAVGPRNQGGRPLMSGRPEGAEALLVVVMGAFEAGEAGDVGVDAGLLHDAWVAGGQGLDLGEGQDLLAQVVDLALGQIAAGDLADERSLPFEGLPSPNFESAVNSMDETARTMAGSGRGT